MAKAIEFFMGSWIIINEPIENVFNDFPYIDLTIFGNELIVFITI